MAEKVVLTEKLWALLDVECIDTSPRHRCIRKLYILSKNGVDDMEMEFHPCRPYRDILPKYQTSYHYCQRHIHKLSYAPSWRVTSFYCRDSVPKLNEFIVNNGIELILFKGGTIELELCKKLDIDCMNIECMGIGKANSHDPREEVNLYYNQLIKLYNQ